MYKLLSDYVRHIFSSQGNSVSLRKCVKWYSYTRPLIDNEAV